jgi:hypothetical protein
MVKTEHRVAVGRWLALAGQGHVEAPDFKSASEEYLGVVVAILAAAHEYKQEWDVASALKTRAKTRAGEGISTRELEHLDLSPESFDKYAEYRGFCCHQCGALMRYESHSVRTVDGSPLVLATYICRACRLTDVQEISD